MCPSLVITSAQGAFAVAYNTALTAVQLTCQGVQAGKF